MQTTDRTPYEGTYVLALKRESFNPALVPAKLRDLGLGISSSSISMKFDATTELTQKTLDSIKNLIIIVFIYCWESSFKSIWENLKSQLPQQSLECLTLCWFSNNDLPLDKPTSCGFIPTHAILNELVDETKLAGGFPTFSYKHLKIFRCPGPAFHPEEETVLRLGKGTQSVEMKFLRVNNLKFLLSDTGIRKVTIYTWQQANLRTITFHYPEGCEFNHMRQSIELSRTVKIFHETKDSFEEVAIDMEQQANTFIYRNQTPIEIQRSCCG
jgi:hypothetical protein